MAGPLAGIRVLDFGMAAVGPLATTYLRLLGADVIKIEQPKGDIVRRPSGPTMQGMGITFIANNYTKRGLCLDLKTDEDREIACKLIATADVVLDNFRSGDIMERLGLGYEVQPQIIPTSVAGLTRYTGYVTTGAVPGPLGSARPNIVPDQAFPTALGYLSVSAVHNGIWARLCAALGRQELSTDPRFVTNAERVKNREVLIPILEGIFKKKAAWQWEQVLKAHGVP